MFPVLLLVYYRLSKREEREMMVSFGEEYRRYMEKTPMFVPRLRGNT
jgi:protein-S-isoprenylcysteine O-methyltransferase Ste14